MACFIKFGSTQGSQAQIMAKLAGQKIEVIQTASGLCARAAVADVKALLSDEDLSGATLSEGSKEDHAAPDVAKFLS